jgi:O-antigen biosynthesis rhamnosyltransferase
LKVLHFYKTFYPDSYGGAEQAIHQICRATTREGVSNTVLAVSPTANPIEILSPEHRVVRAKRLLQVASMDVSIDAFKQFKALAKEVDLIHVHYPWPFMDAVLWASQINRPIVLTYHSDIIRQRYLRVAYAPLERWLLNRVDAVVATSPNYSLASSNLNQVTQKLSVIPLALDETSYPSSSEPLPPALMPNQYFLFVGMLRYYKGLDVLIKACASEPYPIVIAGTGQEASQLRQLAHSLKANNVHFLGEVSEGLKLSLLQHCRAFVFPSNQRSEAFGVSLVEAALHGKPMVSCEIGTGTSFVNQDGQTGLVVMPGQTEPLQAALRSLWEDESKVSNMGRAARHRYETVFAAPLMGRAYAQVYRQLLGRH